jgi:hypothetical protein
MKLDDVAAHAEGGALEIDVVAGVLEIDQLCEHLVAVGLALRIGKDRGVCNRPATRARRCTRRWRPAAHRGG